MNYLSEQKSYWSMRLLALLQDMAAQNTNAVLTVLANVDHLETERRYPDTGLLFAAKRWRAYYHCHEATAMHANEHGHFHLFTDIGNQTWAHVAGLSMDAEGQPLQWFTVNRWVTDGTWLEHEVFVDQLKYVTANDEQTGLVENWLAVLLQLYSDTLCDLFKQRDQQLQHYLNGRYLADTLDDPDIYTLATQSIDLQSMLETQLLRQQADVTQATINKENAQ